jgi:CHAT domain-containing protein
LIALQLREGNKAGAFETLERAKSQVWLGYLMNRDRLHWAQDDPSTRALIAELERLRAEHQWFYRLVHEPPSDTEYPRAVKPAQALAEIAVRERRMRAITEQLYLRNGTGQGIIQTPGTSIREIQQKLGEGIVLVEYYHDGKQLWAFTLDRRNIAVHPLPLTVETLNQWIRQMQRNFETGIKRNPDDPSAHGLTVLARDILQRLHGLLIEPLGLQKNDHRQLVIVPYGKLHFLPFHLLYDGSEYLIERYEVVILPAAGLISRPAPKRAPGALVLTHSWDGRLPYTYAEAKIVQSLFRGELYAEEAATRSALEAKPTQILHIAAHGRHRLDLPDLSYLQLADGQLYADDVLQQDLSYELVTLSACETGQASVAADEELIGIGRGFLYAGAGALILSLWGVADSTTANLMERMYSSLQKGASKSAALREAQRSILAENRNLHPAFWGAFQLIGDAGPLSA